LPSAASSNSPARAQSHGFLATLAREIHQPAHSQRSDGTGTNFDRNLISCTAHTARLHFDQRSDGVESFLEDFQGIAVLTLFNLVQSAINDTLGNGFLAASITWFMNLARIWLPYFGSSIFRAWLLHDVLAFDKP
jgi:hypothetical protein